MVIFLYFSQIISRALNLPVKMRPFTPNVYILLRVLYINTGHIVLSIQDTWLLKLIGAIAILHCRFCIFELGAKYALTYTYNMNKTYHGLWIDDITRGPYYSPNGLQNIKLTLIPDRFVGTFISHTDFIEIPHWYNSSS